MATILIVDDDPASRSFLLTLLRHENRHRLIEADNGRTALTIAHAEPLDLIITDVLMPQLNGYELAEKIHSTPTLSHIPIVFYTASNLANVSLLAMELEVKYVIDKTSEPQLILSMINKVLEERSTIQDSENKDPSNFAITDIIKTNKIIPSLNIDFEEFDKTLNLVFSNISDAALQKKMLLSWQKFKTDSKALQRLSNQFIALINMNIDIFASTKAKDMLEIFCKSSGHIMRTKHCVLGILDDDKDSFKYYFAIGTGSIHKHPTQIKNNGFLEKWIKDKNYILIENIATHQKMEIPPGLPDTNSLLGFPLIYGGTLYGFIYFTDKLDGSKFNDLDIQIAAMLSLEVPMLYAILTKAREKA